MIISKVFVFSHKHSSPALIRLNYFCWCFIFPGILCIADFLNDLHPIKSYYHVSRGEGTHHEKHFWYLTSKDCNVSGINIFQRESC